MLNTRGIAKKALTAAAVAVSAVALGTAPASAQSSNAHGYAEFEDCGILSCITVETAEGWFQHDGDKWRVCDLHPDGHRAGASAIWYSGGAWHDYPAWATNGEGSCSDWVTKNIPEGTKVHLKVWDQEGANGSRQHLKEYIGYA
ncbi:hypothetical protein ACWGI9_40105 [Streptomyces sp. NPDC054833]